MDDVLHDQAEGLRRLLAQDVVRIITVTSGRGGVGKTSAVLNLAIALARRGRRVLLLDENSGPHNLSRRLGLEPKFDLLHVLRREKSMEQIMLQGPEGIDVVPAALGVKALAGLDASSGERLVASFRQFPQPVDVVLMDAVAGIERNVLSLSLAAQEVVVVVSNQPASITDAYALIKVLSQDYAKHKFRILVNNVAATEARAIFENMAKAACRFLDVTLDFMGHIPFDEKLKQSSRLHRLVVEAFPVAPSAVAFRQLAETLEQWPYPTTDNGRLDVFMQRLIEHTKIFRGTLLGVIVFRGSKIFFEHRLIRFWKFAHESGDGSCIG